MSIRIMSEVWEHGPNESTACLALMALADFANDNGECWPSYETIAWKARIGRRQAIRVVGLLVEQGYLLKSVRSDGKSNLYRITRVDSWPHRSVVDDTDDKKSPVPSVTLQPVSSKSPAPVSSVTPKPSVEPPLETSIAPQSQGRQRKRVNLDGFDEFWQHYPRKDSRAEAEAEWGKLSVQDRAAATDGVKRNPPTADEKRFIPHGRKWLKYRRWEDEPAGKSKAQLGKGEEQPPDEEELALRKRYPGMMPLVNGSGLGSVKEYIYYYGLPNRYANDDAIAL
jgi:helix-turn-helix protein